MTEDKKASRPVVKSRRLVGTNSMFEIFFDHLAEPPNREVTDFLVVQPKYMAADGITGICVLPKIGDRFALVNCYRHPLGRMSLEAPKGFIEPGETPPQAALRELAEETGLSCALTNLVDFGIVAPEPGIIKGRVALYVACDCAGSIRIDAAELGMSSVHLLTLAELDAEIRRESIQDAVTLLLISRYNASCRV